MCLDNYNGVKQPKSVKDSKSIFDKKNNVILSGRKAAINTGFKNA